MQVISETQREHYVGKKAVWHNQTYVVVDLAYKMIDKAEKLSVWLKSGEVTAGWIPVSECDIPTVVE